MITDINSEDRLVQQTFAEHLEKVLGPNGTLGRISERDVALMRDLRAALGRLNKGMAPNGLYPCPLASLTALVRAGTISKRSPTMPTSATPKMGASGSLLMAMM